MAWADRFNSVYISQTARTKEDLLDTFKSRIKKAKTEINLFRIEGLDYVDYQKIIIRDDILTVTLPGNPYRLFEGSNIITITLSCDEECKSTITVRIYAVDDYFNFRMLGSMFSLVMVSSIIIWQVSGPAKYVWVPVAWLVFAGFSYVSILYGKLQLKSYAEMLLGGVGVREALVKQ